MRVFDDKFGYSKVSHNTKQECVEEINSRVQFLKEKDDSVVIETQLEKEESPTRVGEYYELYSLNYHGLDQQSTKLEFIIID